jgi:hypothetical protein
MPYSQNPQTYETKTTMMIMMMMIMMMIIIIIIIIKVHNGKFAL